MSRKSASEKLRLLDVRINALMRRFYVRPSLDGAGGELGTSDLFTVNLLGRKGKCTMTELAKECGLALSSMTGIVDRLVVKGVVKRFRDEEQDRRRVFVGLDKKGERIYQQLLEPEMEMIISVMDSLRPAEQDALLEALRKAVSSSEK